MEGNKKTVVKYKTPLKKLRKVRKNARVNQARLAEFLGVTPQFFSLLERGENTLSYHYALEIAKFFDMTPDELFKDDFMEQNKRLQELEKRGY